MGAQDNSKTGCGGEAARVLALVQKLTAEERRQLLGLLTAQYGIRARDR